MNFGTETPRETAPPFLFLFSLLLLLLLAEFILIDALHYVIPGEAVVVVPVLSTSHYSRVGLSDFIQARVVFAIAQSTGDGRSSLVTVLKKVMGVPPVILVLPGWEEEYRINFG